MYCITSNTLLFLVYFVFSSISNITDTEQEDTSLNTSSANLTTADRSQSDDDQVEAPVAPATVRRLTVRPVKRKPEAQVTERELLTAIMSDKKDDDEMDSFGRSVAGTLRRFTARQLAMAEVRIQQVLLEIEFDNKVAAPPRHVMPLAESSLSSYEYNCDSVDTSSSLLASAMYQCGLPVYENL